MAQSRSKIALLLHMHQPDYRDPRSGAPGMPWVRMHAVRGYTDVASLILEHNAAVTVNVVPSLLDQLLWYEAGGQDRWEQLSRVPAEALRPEEAAFIRARFVHGHPTMRAVSPRYRSLEARISELSSASDLRDLQVWSNLAWMGSVARRRPEIRALIEQDSGFTHDQLIGLMDIQRQIVAGVLPLWRRLPHISCTPLCHPILPLLVDLEHARRSLPDLPADLGARFAWPEDAARQLSEGRDRVEAVLGTRPRGLWPSEGSLSPEVVRIAGALGFDWIGADIGLLARSERVGPVDVDRPWRVDDERPMLIFRDRGLSDRVGFDYHQVPGWRAAEDLLEATANRAVVPIILDGENPWEASADAGEGFLRALFGSGAMVSMDEAASAATPGRILRLHTGSWIDANLRIWAGDHYDRVAWRLLGDLRRAWEEAGRPEAAWPHIAAAEGSDWFWWFGPEFNTPFADLFDLLFRLHVSAGWRALGQEPPEALSRPVQPRGHGAVDLDAPGPTELHIAMPGGGAMAPGQGWLRGGRARLGEDGVLVLELALPDGGAEEATEAGWLGVEIDGVGTARWSKDLGPGEGRLVALGALTASLVGGVARVALSVPLPPDARLARLRLLAGRQDATLWAHPAEGWITVAA